MIGMTPAVPFRVHGGQIAIFGKTRTIRDQSPADCCKRVADTAGYASNCMTTPKRHCKAWPT